MDSLVFQEIAVTECGFVKSNQFSTPHSTQYPPTFIKIDAVFICLISNMFGAMILCVSCISVSVYLLQHISQAYSLTLIFCAAWRAWYKLGQIIILIYLYFTSRKLSTSYFFVLSRCWLFLYWYMHMIFFKVFWIFKKIV